MRIARAIAPFAAIALFLAGCQVRDGAPAAPASPTTVTSPTPAPEPDPALDPSQVALPRDALLSAGDLGESGFTLTEDPDGDWEMGYLDHVCAASPQDRPTPSRGRVTRAFDKAGEGFLQGVYLHDLAGARQRMAHVKAFTTACAEFSFDGYEYKTSIVLSGFAGEESHMVKLVYTEGPGKPQMVRHYIFVRRGDAVTQLVFTGDTFSLDAREQLAEKAALRLCVITDKC